MSRNLDRMNDNVDIITGSDAALGYFIDVVDKRYSQRPEDEQGEGYVMEWSSHFGFSNNLIGATEGDLIDDERLVKLSNIFIENLPSKLTDQNEMPKV